MSLSFICHEFYRIDVLDELHECLKRERLEDISKTLRWAFGDNWRISPLFLLPTRWNFLRDELSRDAPLMFITTYPAEAARLITDAYSKSSDHSIPDYTYLDRKDHNANYVHPLRRMRYEHQKKYEIRKAEYEALRNPQPS